jgi:hypothetical protein
VTPFDALPVALVRVISAAVIRAVRSNTGVKPVSPESWAMYYSKRLVPGLVNRLARRGSPLSE